MLQAQSQCFKASETLLGIETIRACLIDVQLLSFKASETLLGIETARIEHLRENKRLLQSLWNPFRDWNAFEAQKQAAKLGFKASETLLGIETLRISSVSVMRGASKPLKPF